MQALILAGLALLVLGGGSSTPPKTTTTTKPPDQTNGTGDMVDGILSALKQMYDTISNPKGK